MSLDNVMALLLLRSRRRITFSSSVRRFFHTCARPGDTSPVGRLDLLLVCIGDGGAGPDGVWYGCGGGGSL